MSVFRRRIRLFPALLALGLCAGVARADEAPPTDEALFAKGSAALSKGEYGAAIDMLESLADRGFLHPAASYDRGLAYLTRIRANAERPGDLGRAAAAFEEALRLDPNDAEADKALDLVRAEVTRRRARKSGSGIDARPTLDRVIAGLVSEKTWAIASIVASLLLAAGILLRRKDRPDPAVAEAKDDDKLPAVKPAHPLRVAGTVLVVVSIVGLLVLLPFAWHARNLRLTTRPGVIVATEAHLTDETGRTLGGDAIPEAAAVEVGERRGATVHVRWGSAQGWLPAGSVRVLP